VEYRGCCAGCRRTTASVCGEAVYPQAARRFGTRRAASRTWVVMRRYKGLWVSLRPLPRRAVVCARCQCGPGMLCATTWLTRPRPTSAPLWACHEDRLRVRWLPLRAHTGDQGGVHTGDHVRRPPSTRGEGTAHWGCRGIRWYPRLACPQAGRHIGRGCVANLSCRPIRSPALLAHLVDVPVSVSCLFPGFPVSQSFSVPLSAAAGDPAARRPGEINGSTGENVCRRHPPTCERVTKWAVFPVARDAAQSHN
jgi:hypothetical protein